MASIFDNDISCGIYRSIDPIQNFKVRVKLERLTSNALIPSVQRLKIQEDLSNLLDLKERTAEKGKVSKTDVAQALDDSKRTEYEEVVVSWQQKLFNRAEFDRYGNQLSAECSAVEKKYYEDIQKMKASRKTPRRVFTYVESDEYCVAKYLEYFMTDSPNEEPSQLALGVNTIRKRRMAQPRFQISDEESLPKTNIVNQKPTPDDIRTNHLAGLPHQTMYIMVDLSDAATDTLSQMTTVGTQVNEHVLCTIRVYTNGTITIEPDFNPGKMAYIVETGRISNDAYHYYLEHASKDISKDDLVKERKLFNEVRLRKQTHLAQVIGAEFERALPSTLKLTLLGEIVSGRNFEYDDLYVYYCLDLPENWYAETSMVFSGYTPTVSFTESSKYDDIVYYAHPFEFEMLYKPPLGSADHELPQMPKIYFQVASNDIWGRHRTEGYTYIDVPVFPGCYEEELSCWRPRGSSIFNELRRFFIGGSNEIEDISYVAIPKQVQTGKKADPLSRFGFRTVSTGSLTIRLNVVFQSEEIALEHLKRTNAIGKGHYGFDAYMSNVKATVEAFEQAKRRAEEVRESKFKSHSPKSTAYE